MIKFLGTSAIAFAAMLLVNIESAEAQGYIGSGGGFGSYSSFGGVGGFFGAVFGRVFRGGGFGLGQWR